MSLAVEKIEPKKQYSREPNKDITPDKIITYINRKSGKSLEKVSKEMGICSETVRNWTGDIEDYIRQSPEYKEAGPQISALIPEAIKVYVQAVKKGNLNAARDILKMGMIYIETQRRKFEGTGIAGKPDESLWQELGVLIAEHSKPAETTPDSPGAKETQGK